MITGRPYDNTNAQRAYPFIEDASLLGMANDVVLDARLLVYQAAGSLSTEPLTLETIAVNGGATAMTVTMKYGLLNLSMVVSAAASEQYYETYATGPYGNLLIMLRMLFGPGVQAFCTAYAGVTVTFSSPQIEPCCVVMYDKHRVSGITGSYAGSVRITGAIKVEEGYNLGIRLDTNLNALVISAGTGLGQGIPCTPLHAGTEDCQGYVYLVNGLHPDWFGEFKLLAGPGINVTPVPASNKLTISTTVDRCQPKCKDPKEA